MESAGPTGSSCPKCRFPHKTESELVLETEGFRKLLESNDLPAESQFEQLMGDRSSAKAKFNAITNEIIALQGRVAFLQRQKTHVAHVIADYDRALHPIKRTPDDVLSEIFLALLGAEQASNGRAAMRLPWKLSAVSRRWRQVINNYPKLWSTIVLEDRDFQSNSQTAFLLAFHLQKTSFYHLRVSIKAERTITQGHFLLHSLLPTSTRWRELCLHITPPSFDALEPIRGRLQSLQSLKLRVITWILEPSPLWTLFEFAPQLSSVHATPDFLVYGTLPRGNLTYYDEGNGGTAESYYPVDIISPMKSTISTCYLYAYPTIEAIVNLNTVIELPNLNEFGVSGFSEDVGGLFSRLKLPNLTRLEIHGHSETMNTHISKCTSLQHMALDLGWDDEEDKPASHQLELLDSLPNISSVHFGKGMVVTQDFLDAFRSSNFAPSLREIYMQDNLEEIQGADEDAAMLALLAIRPGLGIRFDIELQNYRTEQGFCRRDCESF